MPLPHLRRYLFFIRIILQRNRVHDTFNFESGWIFISLKISLILKPLVMKNKILLFTFILSIGSLFGQSVVSSGGQSGASNDLHASATIGEAVIGAQNANGLFLNQGFQQPLQSDITSVVEINTKLKIELSIGPVPASDFVIINVDKPIEGSFVLINQLGLTLKKLPLEKRYLTHTLDMSELNAATYYLTLISKDGKRLTSIPIIKI